MVFGRTLRDLIPCLPYKYAANADWCVSQELKERMMAKSREVDGEKHKETPKSANRNSSGHSEPVRTIFHQVGQDGVMKEVKPLEQIVVKVDGSRSQRNRELDSRKTSLKDQQPATSAAPAQTPRQGRMRQFAVTLPSPMSTAPLQPVSSAPTHIGKSHRGNEELQIGDTDPAQDSEHDPSGRGNVT